MNMQALEDTIRDYLRTEVLEGDDLGLTPETPLLEWGVLNSMELTRLIRFLEQRFGVKVPGHEVVPDNFVTMRAIAGLVTRLAGA